MSKPRAVEFVATRDSIGVNIWRPGSQPVRDSHGVWWGAINSQKWLAAICPDYVRDFGLDDIATDRVHRVLVSITLPSDDS
jgi:hypothetical protein